MKKSIQSRIKAVQDAQENIDLLVFPYRFSSNLTSDDWKKILSENFKSAATIRKVGKFNFAEAILNPNLRVRVFSTKKGTCITILVSKSNFAFADCISVIKKLGKDKKVNHTFDINNIAPTLFGEFSRYLNLDQKQLREFAIELINSCERFKSCYVLKDNCRVDIHYESRTNRHKMEAKFNLNSFDDVSRTFEGLCAKAEKLESVGN